MPANVSPRTVSNKLVTAERDGIYFNAGAQLTKDFASIFGSSFDDAGAVSQSTQGAINSLGYNGFSAFCSEIGVRQNFDCVKFSIYPHDIDNLPKQARVFIRQGSYSGTLLASVLVPFSNVKHKQSFEVTAELGTLIANAGAAEMVLGVSADGYIGYGAAGENPTTNALTYQTDKDATRESISTLVVSPYPEIFAKTFLCGSRYPYTNGLYSTYDRASSNFSGWGNVLSSKPSGPFNVCQLWVHAFNADFLPTRIRVRLREATYNGTILGTATGYVSFAGVGTKLATIYFDEDVDVSAASSVWFEFLTDGYVAFTYSTVTSTSTERYSAGSGIDGSVSNAIGGAAGLQPWVRFIQQDRAAGITFDAGLLAKVVQTEATATSGTLPRLTINMPPKIYCVEDIETNIYWDGLLDTPIPHENFEKDFSASYGQQVDHRWRFTPEAANAGTHDASMTCYYNGTEIASKTTQLVVKADSVGSGVTRKALIVGDSIVNGGVISQTILDNVTASASTYAVTLLGTQGTGSALHEGRSGWTYGQFATAGSPFFNGGGSFAFAAYLSANGWSMASTDSIFIQLGTNDFFSVAPSGLAAAILTTSAYLDALITGLRAGVANVNIWICLTPQPAFSTHAMGLSYGSTYNLFEVKKNYAVWRQTLIDLYGAGTNNIRVLGTSTVIDTRNNYTLVTEALNARNATTASFQSDNVHPTSGGRQQLGDAMYCALKSLES